MSEQTFKAWISKYALTAGIKEIEAEGCFDISDVMIKDVNNKYDGLYHKPHWHSTRDEAVVHAEKMRVAKIASLKRQIAKLERLKFDKGAA